MEIKYTSNPQWVTEFEASAAPYVKRIVHCQYFNELSEGSLSLPRCRASLMNFYPLIQNFPKFMALNLAKTADPLHSVHGVVRDWLIENISVEKEHSNWWIDWAEGFGISQEELRDIQPIAEVDALQNFLWRICTYGSLVEGISATNLAIDGPTGLWARKIKSGLYKYKDREGVRIDEKSMQWVEGHAEYDDAHPKEALELIKMLATDEESQEKAKQAAIRAFEYYAAAMTANYEKYN